MEPAKVSAKLVLLGDSNVGKSSLVLRFAKNKFYNRTENTIGAAFMTKSLSVGKSAVIRFEIWDTAGQERYHSLAPMYYRDARVAIIMYEIVSMVSFEKAKFWVSELKGAGREDVLIAFVGNKCDLEEEREVPTQEGNKYAKANGLIFKETSAKENLNVTELFMILAQNLSKSGSKSSETEKVVDLDLQRPSTQPDAQPPPSDSCC